MSYEEYKKKYCENNYLEEPFAFAYAYVMDNNGVMRYKNINDMTTCEAIFGFSF